MRIKQTILVLSLVFLIGAFSISMGGCSVDDGDSGTKNENISATADPELPTLEPIIPVKTVVDIESNQITSIEKKEYPYSVKEFNVGQGTYVSSAIRDMPYNIDGIIGIPEGEGPFPLVLITHGSHSNDNENLRFDTGYRYLVEELTKQGIVTVSMNMIKPYIWKYGDNDDGPKSQYLALEHLNSLVQANKGEEGGYPADFNLEGKIDFDKIALGALDKSVFEANDYI